MKGKEKEEKEKIKLQFAVALKKALEDSNLTSYRHLASASGLEPAHVQRIASGKVDATLTTNISLSEGLKISYSALSAYYDKVTEKDVQEFLKEKELVKRKKNS